MPSEINNKSRNFSIIIVLAIVVLFSWFWFLVKRESVCIKKVRFNELPSWGITDTKPSLSAFKNSCKFLLKQPKNTSMGNSFIHLTAKDWNPACRAALRVNVNSKKEAQTFFQTWFTPFKLLKNNTHIKGLITGYYVPMLHGSLTKTDKYNIPIYGVPQQRNVYTRKEINDGAISKYAPIIVWVDSPIDRLFMEIQGSGNVLLTDGSYMFVGYSGQNGLPYTPIARVLIEKMVMTKENQSMQGIRNYLESHPDEVDSIINQNESFIYFKKQTSGAAIGANDTALTPGYSVAIDRNWIPMHTPIWISTTTPESTNNKQTLFQRLMIAQDTGGAIRGIVRADVFFGAGKKAENIAGKMNSKGSYWILLPKKD